jgi:hypothetical protein
MEEAGQVYFGDDVPPEDKKRYEDALEAERLLARVQVLEKLHLSDARRDELTRMIH